MQTRRGFLKTIGLGAAAACMPRWMLRPAPTAPGGQAVARPNVIIVLTDDQGYGDLSCHGNPALKTPELDRLHGESIRLTDFHVAPMCTPTRGQILTGRDALANGATWVCQGRSMPQPELPTMAEVFAAGGYRTGHFGKWHLGESYPYRPQDRGFHETVHHGAWGVGSAADYWGNDYFDDTYRHNGRLRKYDGYCTDVWFREAIQWMKGCRERKEPFLLYLATNCPHSPHKAEPRYVEPYQKTPNVNPGFFGQIANIDENMGRLERALRETGLRDDTLLIFITDNGTAAGEKVFNAGMRGKKRSLYEGGHRVPCFVRWPAGGLRGPRDIDELAHCQDLLPTLIELCGLRAPESVRFDGVSLAKLLRGTERALPDRMLVVQYGHARKGDAAVLWKKWRLVAGGELYDLGTDPGQSRNVAADHPDVLAAMRKHYEQWWQRTLPLYEKPRYIRLGSPRQNPVVLYSVDWQGGYADRRGDVTQGSLTGTWDVEVQRDGQYEISLLRWPEEAGLALDAAPQGPSGGRALPIARARLQIGDVNTTRDVASGDKAATFTVRLKAGQTKLQTWFHDAQGQPLCSAYFTKVLCREQPAEWARTNGRLGLARPGATAEGIRGRWSQRTGLGERRGKWRGLHGMMPAARVPGWAGLSVHEP